MLSPIKLCLILITALLLLTASASPQRKGRGPKPKPSPTPIASPTPTPVPTPTPSPNPTPTPIAGDAWTTYGHDSRRSFASTGSINGPLVELWRYRPANAGVGSIHNAIATSDSVYARLQENGGGTGMARLNPDGTQRWLSLGCCNWDRGHWHSLSPDGSKLFVNDDNIFGIATATGARFGVQRIDTWGDTLIHPNGQYYYTVNMHHQLDPCCSFENVFVAAYDPSIRQLWRVWQAASSDQVYGPEDILGGGMALANDTLFIAQTWNGYGGRVPTLPPNGITALNALNGSKRWFVTTTPTSRLSVDASRVYLIEGSAPPLCPTCNAVILTGSTLVARSQSNGEVLWSVPVNYPVVYSNWTQNGDGKWAKNEWRGAHVQSPVLANGLVIITTINGVEAFDAATGTRAWINPAPAIAYHDWGAQWSQAVNTRMAAALASSTLIVTANDGLIYVIDLTTGLTRWQGVVPSAVGVPKNPVIAGNRLYVTDGTDVMNGGVIALMSQ